jgi:hypothetical protein
MPTKKKPAVKKPAGKDPKAKKEAPAKAKAVKAEPAKKAAPSKPVAKPAAKAAEAPKKKGAPVAAKAAVSKSAPEPKGKKSKSSLKELEKTPNKFTDSELDEDMEFQDEDAEEEIVVARPSRKSKPRFDAAAEEEISTVMNFEDADGDVVSEDALDAVETVELEEDDLDEDREGPPPWWKDDPAGIEPEGDEAGGRASFDDSDEWSEDDEDWASKRGSFDDVEDAGDEEDSW